ncbi:intermembrane phospholipid transport protein YdbH family protein [Sphingomicrobium nitratireducens]|uniref:intermembrane phospholipid transport protein YdbH family protein n=1 Tax=Sphingomicrobium nitratireducens TaxID=2964666 RepID=UPI002240697E|nr:YdbH domain-containing protein [Sphingomicrobium nitratireducens]
MDREFSQESVPARPVWHRRRGWRYTRRAIIGFLLLVGLAVFALWLMRRPLAEDAVEKYLESKGVQATYSLDRVGLRTQRLSNLVLGDPDDPDLTLDFAEIKTRVTLTGKVSVYRVSARGAHLRGRVAEDGTVSFGQLDKLLPEPSGEAFRLPDLAVILDDARISLTTPYGPVGAAIAGRGNLAGGFKGMAALSSPGLAFGECRLNAPKGRFALAVKAGRPSLDGPLKAAALGCGDVRVASPTLALDMEFGETIDSAKGDARLTAGRIALGGENGMETIDARLTVKGQFDRLVGKFDVRGSDAAIAMLDANDLRLTGDYRLDALGGTYRVEAQARMADASLDDDARNALVEAAEGLWKTPLEPVGRKLARALAANARAFGATADLLVEQSKDGPGLFTVRRAEMVADAGARLDISGGAGIAMPMDGGEMRFDTGITLEGGDLPSVRATLSDPPGSAPLQGRAEVAPYRAGPSLVQLSDIRFLEDGVGTVRFSTMARVTGPIPGGAVQDLRVPIEGVIMRGGVFRIGTRCVDARIGRLTTGSFNLVDNRIRLCPEDGSMVAGGPGQRISMGFASGPITLRGTLGGNPFGLTAKSGRLDRKEGFRLAGVETRMGSPDAPVVLTAEEVRGNLKGGQSGTFSGASAVVGNVPLLVSEMDGNWRISDGDVFIDGELTVSDRNDPARFYPLISEAVTFTMIDGLIEAKGSLLHPYSGIKVLDVAVTHDLDTGRGEALLGVDDLVFDERLQPEELTPITQGVIALVIGRVRGDGRIAWGEGDEVVSTGTFDIIDTDLAAPFGPVTGLDTTIHFSDLLNLQTPANQMMRVDILNPGIPVEEGFVTYQLLGGQLVKIEHGEWPFMGGTLFLEETVLDFSKDSDKRLTFRVEAFDAELFVRRLEFDETVFISGIFDGAFPLIFDDAGGRVTGGRLDARPGGGIIEYKAGTAELSLGAKLAMSIIRSLRYEAMIVRLDGDLDGEFATRMDIDGVRLGETTAAKIVKSVSNIPVNMNVTINGPFRGLIATLQSFKDPQTLINDILPGPLDEIPGVATEVIVKDEKKDTEAVEDGTEEEK